MMVLMALLLLLLLLLLLFSPRLNTEFMILSTSNHLSQDVTSFPFLLVSISNHLFVAIVVIMVLFGIGKWRQQ